MAPVLSPQAKRIVGLALAAILIGGVVGGTALAAPNATSHDVSSTAAQEEETNVRVVHASPDAPAVDVSVDDETVLENVSYGDVSEYIAVSQGVHNVTITAANDSESVLFEGQVEVGAAGTFTLAVAGDGSEPIVLDDEPPAVDDDEAAVRLAHLAPDADAVDVTVEGSGDVLFDNVSFQSATEYETVPAGDYTLEIREATESNDGDVIATVDVSLEGGTASSAFAIAANESADAPIQVVLASDSTDDEETETAAVTGTAEVGTATETAEFGTETATGETETEEGDIQFGTATETANETETETETEAES